jgi:hypothetical protein
MWKKGLFDEALPPCSLTGNIPLLILNKENTNKNHLLLKGDKKIALPVTEFFSKSRIYEYVHF